jgi:hypothetical protein
MDVGIKTANDQFQSLTTAERTAIAVPIVGQCVWDSDLRQIMVYMNATTGNAWQPIGNSIVCASTTRPVTPFEGQRIYETDTNRSWTYNGAAFVPNDNVFTDEAARDAAITSPTEGMHAYLTASTVAAATGGTTAVQRRGMGLRNRSWIFYIKPRKHYKHVVYSDTKRIARNESKRNIDDWHYCIASRRRPFV